MESRARTSQVADPRTSLAMWLRAGRAQRQLTLDDVARVTKIQTRILEKIEAGQLEGLPAEVFVRGFVKSFARCVGLDESEAAQRYGQCANAPATPTNSVARAFVETLVAAPKSEPKAVPVQPSLLVEPEIFPDSSREMAPLDVDVDVDVELELEAVPVAAPGIEVVEVPVIEVIEIAAATEEIPAKKKRTRKKPTGIVAPRSRKKKLTAEPTNAPENEPTLALAPVANVAEAAEAKIVAALAPEATVIVVTTSNSSGSFALAEASAADEMFGRSTNVDAIDDDSLIDTSELELAEGSEPVVADPWKPTMPPVAASVPWKRPAYPISRTPKANAFALPTLVIDDSDPDLADLEREGRDSATKPGPHRVSFLPPILLDRDDKSSRQGGLTLAVILLLIAATLTLSYLMRRPSVSGDGMTQNPIVDTTLVVA